MSQPGAYVNYAIEDVIEKGANLNLKAIYAEVIIERFLSTTKSQLPTLNYLGATDYRSIFHLEIRFEMSFITLHAPHKVSIRPEVVWHGTRNQENKLKWYICRLYI